MDIQKRYEIYLSFCEDTCTAPVEFEAWAKAEGYEVDPEYGPPDTGADFIQVPEITGA